MSQIEGLATYIDIFKKAKHDFNEYQKNQDPYTFVNCLLTLNALVDWCKNDDSAPQEIKNCASGILNNKFYPDVSSVETDIGHQINFIRHICNHAKHKEDKVSCNFSVTTEDGALFPALLSSPLHHISTTLSGNIVDQDKIIESIINYWEQLFQECSIDHS